MDIEPILKRIARGESRAFAQVVEFYQRPLFGFLGRMGLAQQHAEEVAQETFLRAWTNLAKYRPETAEFSTWLYTIARNHALNELSRLSAKMETPAHDEHPEQACERPEPCEALYVARRQRQLQAALMQLPLAERSTVALAYIKDLQLSEVARIENCSEAAVKTRLHRARQKLRESMEKENG